MEIRKFDLHAHDTNSVADMVLIAYTGEGQSLSHESKTKEIVKDLIETGNNFLGYENIYLCFANETPAGLFIGYVGKSYSKVKTVVDLMIKLRLTMALNYLLVGSELFDAAYTPKLSEDDFYISVIVVDEKFRGRGIGTLLLNHAIETAKSKNCARIVLDVDKENLIAQELYRKFGFIEIPESSDSTSGNHNNSYYTMEYSLV